MSAEQTSVVCGVVLVLAAVMSGCRGQCQEGSRPFFIGVDIGDKAMHITSPDYPEDYPHNTNCAWQFAAGHYDYVIRLRIITLQLDSDNVNCSSDYVDLYDAYFTETHVIRNTPHLARLCSEKYGKEFYSTKPYLYVRFLSDAVDTASGFNLSVVSVPRSEAPTTAVTHPPIVGTTPTPTTEDDSDDLVVKVVGGTIGGLIAFIIIIVAIIFLCRRCLKPCLKDDEDPVPMTVPSAPPHEVAQGPPIYTSLVNDSDSQLSNYWLLPGTPRPDGGRTDASRGTGLSGSPRPGSRLEVPEQNGRSTSPGRGSREGSPRRGPEGSPRQGGRGGSPWRDDRGRSPRRGSPDRSPRQGDRGGSPWRDDRGRSPRRGSPDRSPRPGGRRGSPWRDDRGRSPRRGSPEGSRPRRGSGPPPPIHVLDSSGVTDAPPSYNEAIGASPQPSAPPLPDENFV